VPPYSKVLTPGGRLAPSSPTITEALQARYPDLLPPPRNPIRAIAEYDDDVAAMGFEDVFIVPLDDQFGELRREKPLQLADRFNSPSWVGGLPR
jgi:hypothetical protein